MITTCLTFIRPSVVLPRLHEPRQNIQRAHHPLAAGQSGTAYLAPKHASIIFIIIIIIIYVLINKYEILMSAEAIELASVGVWSIHAPGEATHQAAGPEVRSHHHLPAHPVWPRLTACAAVCLARPRNVNVRAGIRYERLRKELLSLGSEVVTVDYNQPDSLRKVRSCQSKEER